MQTVDRKQGIDKFWPCLMHTYEKIIFSGAMYNSRISDIQNFSLKISLGIIKYYFKYSLKFC